MLKDFMEKIMHAHFYTLKFGIQVKAIPVY